MSTPKKASNYLHDKTNSVETVDRYKESTAEDWKEVAEILDYNADVLSAGLSGFKGSILITDTPTEDGIYTPKEEGTYVNAGGLEYLPSTTDKGFDVKFSLFNGVWTKSGVNLGVEKASPETPLEGGTGVEIGGQIYTKVKEEITDAIKQSVVDEESARNTDVSTLTKEKQSNVLPDVVKDAKAYIQDLIIDENGDLVTKNYPVKSIVDYPIEEGKYIRIDNVLTSNKRAIFKNNLGEVIDSPIFPTNGNIYLAPSGSETVSITLVGGEDNVDLLDYNFYIVDSNNDFIIKTINGFDIYSEKAKAEAKAEAISEAASDATNKANTAENNAITTSNSYTDGSISAESLSRVQDIKEVNRKKQDNVNPSAYKEVTSYVENKIVSTDGSYTTPSYGAASIIDYPIEEGNIWKIINTQTNGKYAVYRNDEDEVVSTPFLIKYDFFYTTPSSATKLSLTLSGGQDDLELLDYSFYLSDSLDDFKLKNINGFTLSPDLEKESVVEDTTVFFTLGKNLFNPNDIGVEYEKYVDFSTGNTSGNSVYNTTGFIKIEGDVDYSYNYSHQIAFYNEFGVYISGIAAISAKTFKSPINAAYVRLTVSVTAWSTFQFEKGTISTDVEDYKYIIKDKYLKDFKISVEGIKTSVVGRNKFNKFDKDFVESKYLVSDGAPTGSNSTYCTTGFIALSDLKEGEKLFAFSASPASYFRFYCFYDINKVKIGALQENGSGRLGVEVIEDAIYVRVSFPISQVDSYMLYFAKDTSSLLYEDYGFKIKKEDVEGLNQSVDNLWLPKEICVAVGRTIEIYNSQVIWTNNIDDYHFSWSGIGYSMKRKWSLKGESSSVGEYELTLKVYGKDNIQLAERRTTVKVVEDVVNAPFTVAGIGDSLCNGKPWATEIASLSNGDITFVGTRQSNTGEGRSGALASYYLGNNSYTFDSSGINGLDGRAQNLNPFWNPSTSDVDYQYYLDNYSSPNPDKLVIWLGTNGIAVDPTDNVNDIKTFIDKIRLTGGSTIPIFVIHTLFRGNQNGLGVQTGSDGYDANTSYKLEEDLKVFNLQVGLYEALKDYSNLYLVPVSTCHDSEYNFGAVVTPVNPRASQTELMPTEATHPQLQGYLQVADVLYSSLIANQ